jgi:hypothetical protein
MAYQPHPTGDEMNPNQDHLGSSILTAESLA